MVLVDQGGKAVRFLHWLWVFIGGRIQADVDLNHDLLRRQLGLRLVIGLVPVQAVHPGEIKGQIGKPLRRLGGIPKGLAAGFRQLCPQGGRLLQRQAKVLQLLLGGGGSTC